MLRSLIRLLTTARSHSNGAHFFFFLGGPLRFIRDYKTWFPSITQYSTVGLDTWMNWIVGSTVQSAERTWKSLNRWAHIGGLGWLNESQILKRWVIPPPNGPPQWHSRTVAAGSRLREEILVSSICLLPFVGKPVGPTEGINRLYWLKSGRQSFMTHCWHPPPQTFNCFWQVKC